MKMRFYIIIFVIFTAWAGYYFGDMLRTGLLRASANTIEQKIKKQKIKRLISQVK